MLTSIHTVISVGSPQLGALETWMSLAVKHPYVNIIKLILHDGKSYAQSDSLVGIRRQLSLADTCGLTAEPSFSYEVENLNHDLSPALAVYCQKAVEEEVNGCLAFMRQEKKNGALGGTSVFFHVYFKRFLLRHERLHYSMLCLFVTYPGSDVLPTIQ